MAHDPTWKPGMTDRPPPVDPAGASAPRRGSAQQAIRMMLRNLEQLREYLHLKIDQVEALAQAQTRAADLATGSVGPSERERMLERRVAELEQVQTRIRDEVSRWEQERSSMLQQIEHDRKLLAEAWERLEYEQTHTTAMPGGQHSDSRRVGVIINGTGSSSVVSAGAGSSMPRPIHQQPAASAGSGPPQPQQPAAQDDSVAQAILRQFQSLQRDVRRNT